MWHRSERTKDRLWYVGWVILAGYTLLLLCRALYQSRGAAADTPVWELQDSQRLIGWMGGLVRATLGEWACFVPLGFAATLIVPRSTGWRRRLPINVPGLLLAGVLATLVFTVKIGGSWSPVAAVGLMIPLLGCLFGVWMGTTWRRGGRARVWLVPKAALLLGLAALGAGVLLWLSLENKPLSFEAARVTSEEKRRLVHLIRSKSPRSLEEGQTHTLQLTPYDINVLLAWGLSLGSPERKAAVQLAREAASLSASVGVPLGRRGSRYLNLTLAGAAGIEKESLRLHVNRCRLGSLELPRWLLGPLGSMVTSFLHEDRRCQPFLDAITGMTIEPNAIAVTYGPVHLPPGFREDLFGPTAASPEILASTRAQIRGLLDLAGRSRGSPPGFGTCFETAFALARARCVERSAVSENQAAIFALGILLGHPRVEEFLGSVLDNHGFETARQALYRVRIRDRSDWTKHFCVSAAIALLSDAVVSDAAGLLKEELDAGAGGSGFSFCDLLADRAGTTFALAATRDEAAARAMQDRLARGFRVDDFFPPAADLPEGIPDAELQSRYGGVGGEPYRRLTAEIERRIAACAAYR
ncbi:MAG: hypothetical protein M1376_06660 [Planctomycetes bacterium]|nr:hypothetical protein [Planctomycetota bacterium]